VGGEKVTARVYDRDRLLAGNVIPGPAVVAEMDSTTLVLPGHAATVHRSGSLLIRPLEHTDTPEA
jgi:N-methylhydantoinase A